MSFAYKEYKNQENKSILMFFDEPPYYLDIIY